MHNSYLRLNVTSNGIFVQFALNCWWNAARILNYYLGQIRLMSAAKSNHAPECLEPAPLLSPWRLLLVPASCSLGGGNRDVALALYEIRETRCTELQQFVLVTFIICRNLRTPTTKRRLGDPDDSYLARCRQRVYKLRRLRLCSCVPSCLNTVPTITHRHRTTRAWPRQQATHKRRV